MAYKRVKFGVVMHQEPLGRDLREAVEDQLTMVRYVRDHGWDGVFTAQHFLTSGLSILQPVPLLGRLIPETGDMDLGIGILLLALYNPVEVAETFATLDVLSGGRLVFGVGLGYREEEYAALGVPRPQRVQRFERNLDIIHRLWSGESVSVDLPWCRLDDARLTTLPLQRPRPPIWVAANTDRAVERAARLGDTWMVNPHAREDTLQRQIELFMATRAAFGTGKPAVLPVIREVFCAKDKTTALELARPYLAAKYQTYSAWGQDKVLADGDTFQKPQDELEEQRFILGSPEDCIRELRWWRDTLDVNYIVIRTHWAGMPLATALSSLELLSREVLPALQN